MNQQISNTIRAYLAGFLDGDGSIYVQAKPNRTYHYGFQIASYIVLYQSKKEWKKFKKIYSLIGLGHIRERSDGILEYIIGREEKIQEFLRLITPFLILKRNQAELMKEILKKKKIVKNVSDFSKLLRLIDRFRELNYSKKRKIHIITP